MKSSKGAAIALSAVALGALSISPIADAAKHKRHHKNATRSASTRTGSGRGAETPLTGDKLTKATDAAKAAVPGGTVWRASTEDPNDASGAAYEVHVTKTDGSEVEVLLDSSFNVVKTQASPQGPHGHGHGGPGDGRGPDAEPELTGDALTKATDAAKAEVPGGTVWRASKEDPNDPSGAAYEVHVTKTDGSEVEVLLDSSFNVVKTQASPQHHR
jgi:uncharacterized membrane protein YkoI